MNKTIKKVIAMTLMTNTFLSVVPVKYLSEFSTKVYAATTITVGDVDVDSDEALDLYDSSSCKSSDKLNSSDTLSEGTSYYTKTSETRVKITLNGQDDDKVRIYKGTKAYSNGRSIAIDSGDTTTLEIRIYNDDYDNYTSSEQKDSDNYEKYVIKVKNTSSSSDDDDDDTNEDSAYLYNIVLDYGEINFSKKTKTYDVNVPTAIDEIRIKAKPEEDDYDVTIDGSTVDEEDKWAETVSLNKGKNVIEIQVEDDDDNKRTYTLNIYRGTTSSDVSTGSNGTIGEIDNKQDSIYLDDFILDDGDTKLQFNKKITSYAIDYKDSYDYILIKTEPEESDNIVRINGDRVETDNYVSKVDLKKGKNVIKVQVDNSNDYDTDDDDYKKRIYTLTVYRGTSEGSVAATNNANNNKPVAKTSQWVNVNGMWQYNDAIGNPLRSMWFLEKSTGFWYYLDASGNMKTGWFQDSDGKWYYLYPSGAMAYNTIIGGYKLGPSGAWIK